MAGARSARVLAPRSAWPLTTRSTGRKSRYAVFAPVTSGVRRPMMDSPSSITAQEPFPHKAEVAHALATGAHVRRDEREIFTDRLLGTYQIRLRIAQDVKPAT